MIGREVSEEHEEERLGGLLRRCRGRIHPDRASLGLYLRSPRQIGKVVTQAEVAEAVGISREWYARMERDALTRVSARTLARIGDVLMMDVAERAALFRLAVPELRSASLTERSTMILQAFGSLRRLMRRLCAATSETEALTLVREHATTMLSSDAMVTFTRVGEGRWVRAVTGHDGDDRGERFHTLFPKWRSAVIDDLQCYTLLTQPGDVITRAERNARYPELAAMADRVLEALAYSDVSFALAHIQSRGGLVARIQVLHHMVREYSELERTQLAALANLTSLVLQ